MAQLIFDFDGTLADSFDYIVTFLAKEAGLPPLSVQRKQAYRGLSMPAIGRRMGHSWLKLLWLFLKGGRRMRRAVKQVKPYAGLPEIIRKLHAEGHELFIVSSNRPDNIRLFLRQYGLYTYFIQIYGNVSLFGKAPALRRLLRQQRLELKDAVYIGDEMRDVQAAQSIGMRVVAVLWGFARPESLVRLKPTAVASDPQHLMQILEDI